MKTPMNPGPTCPNCGRPLAQGALAGLCAACLLGQGANSGSGAGSSARFVPPPLERVARLFPQLEILGVLGAGGMGAVYKARQPRLDRFVALKILPASDNASAGFEERFNREARALARLHHPHIVTVHEFGQVEDLHFFIMEFVDGTNLRQLEKAGRLSAREALQIIPQICDALQYAHDEGVVHRDIKPENVLVDRKGRVKIADFGLAKILDPDIEATRLTVEGQVMGTPHYMAPEQLEKPLSVDHRADIYSLGVVFYEMLTGDLPLGKFAPPSRKVEVDVRLDEVVLRALENDPERRYQHVSEVRTRLESIAVTPGDSSAPASAPKPQAPTFVRFAGFPLLTQSESGRAVHWPGVATAFAMVLGLLTIAFGMVSIVTGGSWMGWLGIVGLPSVVARLALSTVAVAWGVRFAWTAKAPPIVTAPDETLVLKPARSSRKAVIGALWIGISILALGLWSTPINLGNRAVGGVAQSFNANPTPNAAQWLLILGVLLPGIAAPVGATLLGWVAVSEIRLSRGRIGGLRLAVFDGLFFPLFFLDAFLVAIWMGLIKTWVRNRGSTGIPWFTGNLAILTVLGAVALCVLLDWIIVRGVWHAVRLDRKPGEPSEPWWCGKRGATVVGMLCLLVIAAVAQVRGPRSDAFRNSPQQVATRNDSDGTLIATLPNGGTMELLAVLAVVASGPNASECWLPDGKFLPDYTYRIRTEGRIDAEGSFQRNFIFRLTGLPDPKTLPEITFTSGSAGGRGHTTGDGIWRNGQIVTNGWPYRIAWVQDPGAATLRLGVHLEDWRTIATADRDANSQTSTIVQEDPDWRVNFSAVWEREGKVQAMVLRSRENMKWHTRIVAVDLLGEEHLEESSSSRTQSQTDEVWTSVFNLPLNQVKEFRAQIHPIYWVEFRDIATGPTGSKNIGQSPLPFGDDQAFTFSGALDLDTGRTANPPPGKSSNPIAGIGETLQWMQENGFDGLAGADKVETLGVIIVPLDSSDWATLDSSELERRLGAEGRFQMALKPSANPDRPATFGYRTREGGTGLLQLLTVTPEHATMRQKRVIR